jgi:hypothetical protein
MLGKLKSTRVYSQGNSVILQPPKNSVLNFLMLTSMLLDIFFVQKKVQIPHKTLVRPNKSQAHQNGECREQWVSIVNHLLTKARMNYIPKFLNFNWPHYRSKYCWRLWQLTKTSLRCACSTCYRGNKVKLQPYRLDWRSMSSISPCLDWM